MGKILEADLVIKGTDKTGAAFGGVIRHAQELKRTLAGIGGMGINDIKLKETSAELRQQTRLLNAERVAALSVNRAFAAGNGALTQRTALLGRLRQRMDGMAAGMGMYGWMAGGYMAGRTARSIGSDTAAFEHQRAMLSSTTGMSAKEVGEAVATAITMRVPTMSAADNLRAIGELRMVFGSTEEAIKNVASMQRAAAIMKAVNPEKNAEAESYDMARALELKGVSMDPAHFNRLSSMMVQAINASRGKVTGEGFFEFTQYARGAARDFSDEFYTRVAPTLIQEMRPTSAGRGMASLYGQVIGGKMTNRAAEEWAKLGLLDPHGVIRTKTGSVKGVRPGSVVDSDLFARDPYAWIQGYLKPALEKHGFKDQTKISEEIAHMFSNMYAAQIAGILLTQRQRIEKDWGVIGQAPGSESLDKLRLTDPLAAARDLGAGISTLLAALGSPLAHHAIAAMNDLSDGAQYLGEWYSKLKERHPFRTEAMSGLGLAGLGYVGFKGLKATFGLFSGSTALKGSAAALDAAAAQLSGAAVKLGGGSVAGAGTVAAATGGSILAAGAVVGGVVAGGAALSKVAADMVANNTDYFLPDIGDFGMAANIMKVSRAHAAMAAEELTDAGRRRITVDDIHGALYGGEAPKAEITGNAELTANIKVSPSPDFWTQVETKISNAIHGVSINGTVAHGTSGSTGPSMPEAAPMGAP